MLLNKLPLRVKNSSFDLKHAVPNDGLSITCVQKKINKINNPSAVTAKGWIIFRNFF